MSLIDPSRGTYGYASGDAGTVTVPAKALVIRVWARGDAGGGTIEIDSGDATPVVENGEANHFPCGLRVAEVVFTGTVSYIVEWLLQD